jgi:uncharacterized membrane protein YedE/YeeE
VNAVKSRLLRHLPYLFWGALFGFILSRAGATSFRLINDMFLLKNFHLYGVIGGAIATATPGIFLLKRLREAGRIKRPMKFPSRKFALGTWAGAPLFGIGWAITGTCPGTSLSQLGEGHFYALATVLGILFGNWLFYLARPRFFGDVETCG